MTAIETAANLENLNRITNTTDDAKYMPVFPRASSLLLNSGNVVSSDRLKKRTNLNPEEEVNIFHSLKIGLVCRFINETSLNFETPSMKCVTD